jgi:hypothetical protein
MMIIKWTFIKEKTSKKEDKHMGSQKRCEWNSRPEQLSSLFLLAQSFQFYNSISTTSFVVSFSEALSLPASKTGVSTLSLWKYDHSIIVSVCTGSLLANSHMTAVATVDNTEQSACDQLCWYPLIMPTGQSKQSNCLWHTLWPNCTDCRKVTCMALRGLPFGTMFTPHSVEVWQVVEEKKWGATSRDTDMMDIS